MHHSLRALCTAAAIVATACAPAQQTAVSSSVPATAPGDLTADLLRDITDLETKMLGLVRAIPADKWDWRPATGVRSIGEVALHVAADNYLLPAALGDAADPSTGIKGDDYSTAQAYERRQLSREATLVELERSFAHLRRSLTATPATRLGSTVSLFGRPATVQQTWILTATHLHEHLGQLIAYARTNGVVPPWSQGG